jgi:hypothetical protein
MLLFSISVTCIHTFIEYKKHVDFNNVLREVIISNIDLTRDQFVSKVNYILDTEKDDEIVRAYVHLYDRGFEGIPGIFKDPEVIEKIKGRLQ